MDSLLQAILDWVTLHPVLAGLVVFLIALLESLIVIGLLIPGAFLLFGAGALIATGNLPLVLVYQPAKSMVLAIPGGPVGCAGFEAEAKLLQLLSLFCCFC